MSEEVRFVWLFNRYAGGIATCNSNITLEAIPLTPNHFVFSKWEFTGCASPWEKTKFAPIGTLPHAYFSPAGLGIGNLETEGSPEFSYETEILGSKFKCSLRFLNVSSRWKLNGGTVGATGSGNITIEDTAFQPTSSGKPMCPTEEGEENRWGAGTLVHGYPSKSFRIVGAWAGKEPVSAVYATG